jgi:hypothetical protein
VIAARVPAWRSRLSAAAGPLAAAAGVALFFVALRSRGWYWPDFGVPGGTGLYFLDLRFFTSAWECVRDGVDVVPANPCDPRSRAFAYPRVWLVPAPLGLGQDDTVRLGKVLVAVFFASAFLAMGRARLREGVVWAAALCSPAVMLGIERGNPDLLMFCLVVWAVLLLHTESPLVRGAAHGLFLLAAVLKLYPVLAWGPLLRQPRRWAVAGTTTLAAAFAVYAVATRDDVRRVRETVIKDEQFAYGAPILGDEAGGRLVVLGAGVLLALLVAALAARRRAALHASRDRDLDLFLAGATIFAGTFALDHNYNYRMVFLLLTLPQLLRWAREHDAPVPLAPLAVVAVVATLWLGASSPVLGVGDWWVRASASFPYDELVNVALLGYFAAAVVLVLVARRAGIGSP